MKKKLILIIEDSEYLAASVKDALEMHEYDVVTTHTGTEGIDTALQQHPDLILLDIRLPDITGYEVYSTIKDDSWGKTARITILTASESLDVIAKNIGVPIEHILFKPDNSLSDIVTHVDRRLASE